MGTLEVSARLTCAQALAAKRIIRSRRRSIAHLSENILCPLELSPGAAPRSKVGDGLEQTSFSDWKLIGPFAPFYVAPCRLGIDGKPPFAQPIRDGPLEP
jgi:hypothetical protein